MAWNLKTPVLETPDQKYERQLQENFSKDNLMAQVKEMVETVKTDWHFVKGNSDAEAKTQPDCFLIRSVHVMIQRQLSKNPGMPAIRLEKEKKQLVVAVDFVRQGKNFDFPLAYLHSLGKYTVAHFAVNDAMALMADLDTIVI